MRFNPPIFLGTLILFVTLVAAAIFGYLISQLIRGFLTVDVLTFSLTLFLIVTIGLLIYALLLLIKREQSLPLPRSIPPQPIERPLEAPFVRRRIPRQSSEISLEAPVVRRRILSQQSQSLTDSQLQNRLIHLLSGDRAAADQLVNQVKLNYPGRSEDWYWHKVIDDLEGR